MFQSQKNFLEKGAKTLRKLLKTTRDHNFSRDFCRIVAKIAVNRHHLTSNLLEKHRDSSH